MQGDNEDTCTHNHTLQPPNWERHFDKAFERASGSHDHSFYTDLFSSYDTQLHLRTCYSRLSFDFGKKRLRRHTEVQYLYSIQDVQHRAPEKERKGILPSAIKKSRICFSSPLGIPHHSHYFYHFASLLVCKCHDVPVKHYLLPCRASPIDCAGLMH